MSNGHKVAALSFSVALVLAGVTAMLWLLGGSYKVALAQAGTGIIRVAPPPTGNDAPGCGSPITPCLTVQYAVDQAAAGDEIRVASGLYTGVQGRPAPAGYNGPSVITQVVYISKTVTIRGGYTTTFTDPPDPGTNPTTLDAQGQGRVIFVTADPSTSSGQAISPTIEGLHITGGDAAGLGGVWNDAGGGVYVISSTATISNNHVFSNTAEGGGGLFLRESDAVLSSNTIAFNIAEVYGGGLCLWTSDATLSSNTVTSNMAEVYGGGLYLNRNDVTLSGNIVISNTAEFGGGLFLEPGDATFNGNIITANTATSGGGLCLYKSDATLTNTVVTDNQASTAGSGLYILASSPRLLHTTIARNSGGDGSGVCVIDGGVDYSTVVMTNTILVSHSVGITVTAGNTATLEGTLWYSNTAADWGGAGTIVTGTHNYWDDPLFATDGYHLMSGSAAIDKGVDAGVTTDIDGDPRDATPDLGADEWVGTDVYLPLILKNASP